MSRARENADGARLDAPLESPTFSGTVVIPSVSNLSTAVVANTAKVTNSDQTLSDINALGITTLGTVTAGTIGSAVTLPDRVLFDYQIVSNKGRYTMNASGTNAGLGGFTGTLKYSSEIHVIKINAYRGGTGSNGPQDTENFGVSLLSSATPSVTNGQPTSNLLPDFNLVNSNRDIAYWDVPPAFSNGSHGDNYHFYNHFVMTHATVTGTPGATTYAYYAWFHNNVATNSFVGGSNSDSGRCPPQYVELMKYTV